MSADFDVQTTQVGDKGKITVEALNRDSAFLNFLSISGTGLGPDVQAEERAARADRPGHVRRRVRRDRSRHVRRGAELAAAPSGEGGVMLTGMAVNSSPELRDLKSNDALLREIAERTGGRVLEPFDAGAREPVHARGLAADRFAAADLGSPGADPAGDDHPRRRDAPHRVGLAGDEEAGDRDGREGARVHGRRERSKRGSRSMR